MTFEIGLVFAIIGLAMILFFTERLSIDTVSIGIMGLFIFTGILDLEEGFAGFSNPATVTVAAMFVISAAIFNTGLLDSFGRLLTLQAQKSEVGLILSLMLSAGILSAFINDTAVVALLMPTVIQLAKKNGISPSRVLMPLSFGALMGGICTLLGTSTNILVSGIAAREGLEEFGVFEMTKAGVIFFIAGIIYMISIGTWLIPKRKAHFSVKDSSHLGNYLIEIVITKDFEQINEPFHKQKLFKAYPVEALQILRADGRKVKVYPNTPIEKDDLIRITCEKETIQKLKKFTGLSIKSELEWSTENVTDDEVRLYEALVTPNSDLVNKKLLALNFRHIFDQITVVGIRHRAGLLEGLLKQTKLRAGDILLLRGTEDAIQRMSEGNDLLLLAENKSRNINKTQGILTVATLAVVILLSAFKVFPIAVCAIGGVVVLVLLKSINPLEAYKAIDWKVIMMLAGVLSMGAALEKTGGAQLLGDLITENLGEFGPRAVLGGIFGLTFLLTNIMSNNATAALLAPIAITVAASIGVDSRPFLMAVTFAASLSFMSPMGYQTNTMIYNPGNYKFRDYLVVGIPLNLIMWILATWLIPYFYPF